MIPPSVADDYQGTGVGSLLLELHVGLFRGLGYKRMVLIGEVLQEVRVSYCGRVHHFDAELSYDCGSVTTQWVSDRNRMRVV